MEKVNYKQMRANFENDLYKEIKIYAIKTDQTLDELVHKAIISYMAAHPAD